MCKMASGALGLALIALISALCVGYAQVNVRLRGTVQGFEGNAVIVKSRDGADLKITLADSARIVELVPASLSDIKQGSHVGIAAMPQADGSQKALSVEIFPEAGRGEGEGFRPWDLRPGSTMTNANVESNVASVDGQTLVVKYRDGEKKITVPPTTPIVTRRSRDKNDLRLGVEVTIVAAKNQSDGTFEALRVDFYKKLDPTPRVADQNSLEELLASAIAFGRPTNTANCAIVGAAVICGPGFGNATSSQDLASALSAKLREMPAKYNKPGIILLGTSTPIEFVIQTADAQPIDHMFKGLSGDITPTTVKVADNVSAQLTGPRDMVAITLRGEPLRTINKGGPVSWIWDVQPLKPGNAQVVLEVFSHVRTGAEEQRAQIRVFQDTWTMEARGIEWLKYKISEIEPIRAFLFALASGAVATMAYFGIKGRQSKQPHNDET